MVAVGSDSKLLILIDQLLVGKKRKIIIIERIWSTFHNIHKPLSIDAHNVASWKWFDECFQWESATQYRISKDTKFLHCLKSDSIVHRWTIHIGEELILWKKVKWEMHQKGWCCFDHKCQTCHLIFLIITESGFGKKDRIAHTVW